MDKLARDKTIVSDINEKVVSALRREGTCLHSEAPTGCSGSTINSHSVSKQFLKKIASNNNEAYTLSATPSSTADRYRIQTISINRASAFRGFCSFHDNALFLPIEGQSLKLNRRHAFLLAYRALSKLTYNIEALRASGVPNRIPLTSSAADRASYEPVGGIFHDPASISLDVPNSYKQMQRAIRTGNYNKTRFLAIEVDRVPTIMCCTALLVMADINGKPLQTNRHGHSREPITVSLLPYKESSGVLVFAWYRENEANKSLAKSMAQLSEHLVPDTIVRFLFHHAKDIFFETTWWNNLSNDTQHELSRRFLHSFRPSVSNDWLDRAETQNRYVSWKVTDFITNLKL